MIRLIASLGGFLGRKSDGEPGAKSLWIKLHPAQRAMLTFSTPERLALVMLIFKEQLRRHVVGQV
jgi:hypothetical protein